MGAIAHRARFLDISSSDGATSMLTCRCGRRVLGDLGQIQDPGCNLEHPRSRDATLHGRGRATPHKASMPRVPNRRTILGPHQAISVARQQRYYGRHVSADKIVAADSPRLFIHADEPRRYYQRGSWDHSPAHRKRKICLPECPTVDGSRAPGHHQRAYSCAKRRKNLYSPSYFHILDQMMSLSGTAAWQVVRPPLSANGPNVVEGCI